YLVLPMYSALPPHLQARVFQKTPMTHRKIVIATNIAETSLTIPNIVYVIDCGKVKRKFFDPFTGVDIFEVVNISKSEAWQRSGRAGRDGPGHALRLYTEREFESFADDMQPEILRSNLGNVILQLKVLGIKDIASFDLIDKPDALRIRQALLHLLLLGAIDENHDITQLGKEMSSFPLEPMYSKALAMSHTHPEYQCTSEIVGIVSMLSVDNVFHLPSTTGNAQLQAYNEHKQFGDTLGDHITLLNVLESFVENKNSEEWCKQRFLNYKSLVKAFGIRHQLLQMFDPDLLLQQRKQRADHVSGYDPIIKCLLEGLFLNVAYLGKDHNKKFPSNKNDKDNNNRASYQTYINHLGCDIHPSSVLFHRKPKPACILYNAMIKTKKMEGIGEDKIWLRECVEIPHIQWLDDIIPNLANKFRINQPQQSQSQTQTQISHSNTSKEKENNKKNNTSQTQTKKFKKTNKITSQSMEAMCG
ncbi:ATP-dependent RNA helicase, partial [Reticulomyxa filosa]